MKFYRTLVIPIALILSTQAQAAVQCEFDQIIAMGCVSAIAGEGIGTSVFLITTEYQQCRHGVLEVEARTVTGLIDAVDALDTKVNVEPKMSVYREINPGEDVDPRIRLHMLTGGTIKLDGNTFKINVSKKPVKADPNSMQSYYDGSFVKTNSTGKTVETGKLICTVNF